MMIAYDGGRVQTAARGGCPAAGGFNIGRVQESRSQKVEPRLVLTGSDSRLLDCNSRNKARMSMKTKERRRNQPPLAPPYPRRGIPGLPSSDEEGLGWWDLRSRTLRLGVKPGFVTSNKPEQSENVYENKGGGAEINHPWPLLIQGGEFPDSHPQMRRVGCGTLQLCALA